MRDNHTAREGEGENGGGLVIPSAAAGGSLFFLVLQLAERGGGNHVLLHSLKYELGVCMFLLSVCPLGSDLLSTEAKCKLFVNRAQSNLQTDCAAA